MEESTSREKILKKVRNALISKNENPYPSLDFESPVFKPFEDSADITFAQKFTQARGKFIYCEDKEEMIQVLLELITEKKRDYVVCSSPQISGILDQAGIAHISSENTVGNACISITGCECLVARTGGIIVSSGIGSGRKEFVFPDCHIVLAYTSQIVNEIRDGLNLVQARYPDRLPSQITMITGPSRTADIEKTLVMGAHGPKELFLLLTEG
ncbi:MAG: LUD domain-containing protein [Bacteroidales bacterium]|nr:LUD domain-containing protein [Bacteroidales bacterium]